MKYSDIATRWRVAETHDVAKSNADIVVDQATILSTAVLLRVLRFPDRALIAVSC